MPQTTLQSWLARLSMSFLIVAGLMIYHLWKVQSGQLPAEPTWKIVLLGAGSIACIILGMTGIRIRHQDKD